MRADAVIGTVTSGALGHRTGMNLAMAFLQPEASIPGAACEIDVIGHRVPAEVIPTGPYAPENARVRA